MCGCEATFTCSRCYPRWMGDIGEWTRAEQEEWRRDQDTSVTWFEEPFKQ